VAGRGPAPKPADQRRTRHAPQRGEWQATPGIGWQHGDVPKPPTGMARQSRITWMTWMHAWFAAHWTSDDVPVLRQIIRIFDAVERGVASSSDRTELRQLMDSYGITPKGQQDRRWTPPWMLPKAEESSPSPEPSRGRFAHLKVVNE
jgi:hypothetical protein